MKRRLFTLALSLLWVALLVKTLLAMRMHDMSATRHFYSIMLENTWQAQFNFDLLIHVVLFACWVVYRAKSKVAGVICALASIYLGGLFSLPFLIFIYMRSGGNWSLFFMGTEGRKSLPMSLTD